MRSAALVTIGCIVGLALGLFLGKASVVEPAATSSVGEAGRRRGSGGRLGRDPSASGVPSLGGLDLDTVLDEAVRNAEISEEFHDCGLTGTERDLAADLLRHRLPREFREEARESATCILEELLRRRAIASTARYLSSPPRIVFRVVGTGTLELEGPPADEEYDPVALGGPLPDPPDGDHAGLGWSGGLIPDGSVLVIEEARVRARAGAWAGSVSLGFAVASPYDALSNARIVAPLVARFRGRVIVWPSEENWVFLSAAHASVEVEFLSSLVDRRDGGALPAEPLRLVRDADESGVVPKPAVRVQVRGRAPAEDGASEETRLELPGRLGGRRVRLSNSPLWGSGRGLDEGWAWAWFEGAGTLAPGLAWRITRIVTRARSVDLVQAPALVVSVGGVELVRAAGDAPQIVDGVWEGEAFVRTHGDQLAIVVPAGVEVDVTICGEVLEEPLDDE